LPFVKARAKRRTSIPAREWLYRPSAPIRLKEARFQSESARIFTVYEFTFPLKISSLIVGGKSIDFTKDTLLTAKGKIAEKSLIADPLRCSFQLSLGGQRS